MGDVAAVDPDLAGGRLDQAQHRAPTNYEDLLGDAIERSFAAGVHDLAGLVESLNRQGMTTRAGQPWTEANYGPEMAELSR